MGKVAKASPRTKIGRVAGKALMPVGSAIDSAYRLRDAQAVEQQFGSGQITQQEREIEHAKNAAGLAGGWSGALAGAEVGATTGGAIGTVVAPGLGTAVGAAVGGAAGGVAGYFAGETAFLCRIAARRVAHRASTGALTPVSSFLDRATGTLAFRRGRRYVIRHDP